MTPWTIHGILQAGILEWVAFLFSKGSSQPRDQTQISHIVGRFPAEPQGKSKNTGVANLALLQGIFLTQESNWGLLHCRWILYRLSHQGRPRIREWVACPFSRDLPDPGIELGSPALQADSLPAELPGKPMGPGATKRIRTPQLPPGIQGGGRGRSLK